jgi:hypothetical protein
MTEQAQTETLPADAWGLTAEQATAKLDAMTKRRQREVSEAAR